MWSRYVAAAMLVAGAGLLASACAVTVDEGAEDEEEADVGLAEERFMWRPRIIRPTLIDPGWRILRCLPDPRKRYIARDPEACAAIRFFCAEGEEAFFDRCGCGCMLSSSVE